jgi:hypothetical protein
MKALSIQQPWAWLIANGHKEIENRNWRYPPSFRGTFLIHAGKKPDKDEMEDMSFIKAQLGFLPPPNVFDCGGIVGMADLVDVVTTSDSPWFFGPLGFVIKNARPLPFIPFKGELGFFNVPDSLLTAHHSGAG